MKLPDLDTLASTIAWARSRIAFCREQERKFARSWSIGDRKGPPQALVEAWTERRALCAVLSQLGVDERTGT